MQISPRRYALWGYTDLRGKGWSGLSGEWLVIRVLLHSITRFCPAPVTHPSVIHPRGPGSGRSGWA